MYGTVKKTVLNLIILETTVFCFNFEDRDPLVKKAPEDQINSYFGFSVAQHKTEENSLNIENNWLLVGAPLGQNLQPGSNHSGALFKCPVTSYEYDCEQIETDGKRDAGGKYIFDDFDYEDDVDVNTSLKGPGPDEIKTGQWLGVTVKSQKPGGIVIVCAHRYIQSPDLSKFHYGQGLCYLLDAKLNTYESLQLCKGRPVEKLHQQFGFCQVGTSASFVGDEFALMGSPGPYTWRGTIFGQVVIGDFLTKDKTIYHGPLSDTEIIEKYSYLGMSVGGGHFSNRSAYTYISGAPRSKMKGQVYFFEKYNNEELNISLIITGEQFASSFGYELLAVDVNNDGYDDLLVGAPFYYGEKKGGAVYIYYNIRDCTWDNCKWDTVMYGQAQSRYGFSMTSLGDINKDGYNDVAIGAPYEADHGAVYIYLGSANGLNSEPSQVIRIKQLTTLGYSLSGGMDMDNNGYPDLLVGAYESERVLLFKTRPIIDIKIKIKSDELKNINSTRKGCLADPTNHNYTCFSFQSCFSIVGKLKQADSFNVNYHIMEVKKHVSRIWFKDKLHIDKRSSMHTDTVVVSGISKQYCQDETVYIKEGITDILSPIKLRVNYTLEDNRYNSPILNKTSVKTFEATFQKECGDDDVCESNLVLDVTTNLQRNVDGSYNVDKVDEDFILEARVKNLNEPAYEAKLFVVHPNALSYIALKTGKNDHVNVKCSVTNETLVACDLGNPFHGKQSVVLNLRFEVIKTTKEQTLELKVFVNSTSKELSTRTSQTVVAILQKIAKFHISWKGISNIFYGGKIVGESAMKNLEDIGARVSHKYQIDNNGQWDLPDIKVTVRWPIQVSPGPDAGSRPGKWLLYLESVPVISGTGVYGYCEVLDRSKVNELNLTLSKQIDDQDNLTLPDSFLETNESTTVKSRRKRDVNYVVPTQITERGGKKRKIVVMDCDAGTAKCVEIICSIKELKKGNTAYVNIKSRLWNSTLVEDYSKVDWVSIRSKIEIEISDSTFNSSESIPQFSAETIAYPEIVLTEGVNWWIIGGAILAGLLLLILLIVILYKCGFFKRKRVSNDPTLSGNLQKKGESETLLENK